MRASWLGAFAVWIGLFAPGTAHAWIYPEHREIGVRSWGYLTAQARGFYGALWARAREGYGAGLCFVPVTGERPLAGSTSDRTPCIDYAAWPAIAADHSCSPDQLLDSTLPGTWIHDVARVSERVRLDLAASESETARQNVWLTSNLLLQGADDDYVTRAGANNAHFLLPFADDTLSSFIARSSRLGAPLNAVGLYVEYHRAALSLAASLGPDGSRAPGPAVRRVLALEAFALHFLQDAFSSGHIAGTWGDVATRKGTHDYYSIHGYSTTTWSGQHIVSYGDAHIRAADYERAARAVAMSLEQIAEVARIAPPSAAPLPEALATLRLDSCNLLTQPKPLPASEGSASAIEHVLVNTPLPGRGADAGAWPRFRSDFGPFFGVESALAFGGVAGGYGGSAARGVAELSIGVRFGYGLEDVVATLNSGTMYVFAGVTRQSEQVDLCSGECPPTLGSSTLPRVPSRAGLSLAVRMPFWLLPGDLLLLAPVLGLAAPKELTRVAIRAASGGLIPWQRTVATGIGHFELVAGRVVYVNLYGLADRTHSFAWANPDQTELASVGFRSVMLTFPALEYTPFRTVAQKLTASLQVQLAYAIDIPYDVVNYMGGNGFVPDWGPAHQFLLRVSMNGRSYL